MIPTYQFPTADAEFKSKKPLHVLFLCPWNVACGIYTYSKNLIDQLEAQGVQVEIFANTTDYLGMTKLARETHADIVHIQHEFGISLASDGLMSVIAKFEAAGHPVIITLHTEDDGTNIMLDGVPSGIILHNDVKNWHTKRMFSKFAKIPHGIPEFKFKESKAEYRKKYGIPQNAFVIGTCGFMSSDRGQMLETLLQDMVQRASKSEIKPYFHFVMSAHRKDAGGQFANLVKSTLINLAEKYCMADCLQVNTEFIPVEEFRERIATFDVGFSYASPKAASNSGSAADMVSCGVPVVVNDAPHFAHLAPYSTVVAGGVPEIAQTLWNMFYRGDKESLRVKQERAAAAIADLGYSKAATKHIELYNQILSVPKGSQIRDAAVEKATKTPKLNKDQYISIAMPNSVWQVMVLWTKLQQLVNDGYRIRLVIQNDGLTDISTLRWVLKGLAEVQFADVGLQQDSRLVRLQSRALAQTMTFDIEAMLRQGQRYSDLASFLPQTPVTLNLGEYATNTATELIGGLKTLVVVVHEQPETVGFHGEYQQILVIGSPVQEEQINKIAAGYAAVSEYAGKVKTVVEDFRTCWAVCTQAEKVLTPWNAFAVVSALSNVSVELLGAQFWELQALADIELGLRQKPVEVQGI
jgi:hypothetical protein